MGQKIVVELSDEERDTLIDMTRRGQHGARPIQRAQILLMREKGMSRPEISAVLHCDLSTVTDVSRRYVESGLDAALFDRPRTGRPAKLGPIEEAKLTAIACSPPPEGHARWTLGLLRDELIVLTELEDLSTETVRLTLKKTS